MSMSKQFRTAAAILVGGVVVASSACSVESTSPSPQQSAARTPERVSQFAPTDAQKALVGVTDGVYRVTFDPHQNQVLSLGPNRLEIPANAVCDLGTSSYGPAFWNSPCTPETNPVKLTVTVKDASTDHPSVEFQPAMRFNPQTTVSLFMYVPQVTRDDAKSWVILYCPNSGSGSTSSGSGSTSSGSGSGSSGSGGCVNEALADRDLTTYVDFNASVLFRRLKHFSLFTVSGRSGYTVSE